MKKILGLDTGNIETGYALLRDDEQTSIIVSGKADNNEVFDIIKECDILVLEVIRNQGKKGVGNTVFITSQWVGRFYQAAVNCGITEIVEVTKKQHGDYHEQLCWEQHGKLFKGNPDSRLLQSLQMLYPTINVRNNDSRNAYSVAQFYLRKLRSVASLLRCT